MTDNIEFLAWIACSLSDAKTSLVWSVSHPFLLFCSLGRLPICASDVFIFFSLEVVYFDPPVMEYFMYIGS